MQSVRPFTWWHRRPRAGRPPAQLTVSTSGTPATSTEQLRLYTTARDRSKCETALDVGHKALPTDGIPRHGTSRRQFTHRRFLPLSTGLLRWSKFFSDTFFAANMDYIFFRQSGSELIFSHVSIHTTCCIWGGFSPGAGMVVEKEKEI